MITYGTLLACEETGERVYDKSGACPVHLTRGCVQTYYRERYLADWSLLGFLQSRWRWRRAPKPTDSDGVVVRRAVAVGLVMGRVQLLPGDECRDFLAWMSGYARHHLARLYTIYETQSRSGR